MKIALIIRDIFIFRVECYKQFIVKKLNKKKGALSAAAIDSVVNRIVQFLQADSTVFARDNG